MPQTYSYDPDTGEYAGTETLQVDPLESKIQGTKIYLHPAFTTTRRPPNTGENEVAVFSNDRWRKKKDFRGTIVFNAEGDEHVIRGIGVIPRGFTERPPTYYSFDIDNGEYTGVVEEREANTTITMPPNTSANEVAVFQDDVWSKVADYRGENVYDSGRQERVVDTLGPISDGWTIGTPPPLTYDEKLEELLKQRKERYETETDPLILEATIEELIGNTDRVTALRETAVEQYQLIKIELPKPEPPRE